LVWHVFDRPFRHGLMRLPPRSPWEKSSSGAAIPVYLALLYLAQSDSLRSRPHTLDGYNL
jgi:hypothetical protein